MTTVMSPPPLLNKYVAMTSSIFLGTRNVSIQFVDLGYALEVGASVICVIGMMARKKKVFSL